jgi:hypothetical protein
LDRMAVAAVDMGLMVETVGREWVVVGLGRGRAAGLVRVGTGGRAGRAGAGAGGAGLEVGRVVSGGRRRSCGRLCRRML